jgi:hypothetical protein
MNTATQILNQLGGNKFVAMTGSNNFVSTGNGLRMSLRKNSAQAKQVSIELNSLDLYDVHFYTFDKEFNIKTKAKFENVYCDMLQSIFTKVTGLYTSL